MALEDITDKSTEELRTRKLNEPPKQKKVLKYCAVIAIGVTIAGAGLYALDKYIDKHYWSVYSSINKYRVLWP